MIRPHSWLSNLSTGLIMRVSPNQTLAQTSQWIHATISQANSVSLQNQRTIKPNTVWPGWWNFHSYFQPSPSHAQTQVFFKTISLAQATSSGRKLPLIKACHGEKSAGTGLFYSPSDVAGSQQFLHVHIWCLQHSLLTRRLGGGWVSA